MKIIQNTKDKNFFFSLLTWLLWSIVLWDRYLPIDGLFQILY